jgi:hypothetical protein
MNKLALSSMILVVVGAVAVAGCGSSSANSAASEPKTAASKSALTSSSSPSDAKKEAAEAEPPKKSAAEEWAEKKIANEAETAKKESRAKSDSPAKTDATNGDPLATNSEIEESSIPKTEITPAKQVKAKSPRELNAAMNVVKSAGSVDEAAKKLTQKLGKPNWTEAPKSNENSKKRIWVAQQGNQCHRLVLDPDGSVEVESASKTEWRMLAASARQNPCTGEIKRGINNK